MQKRYRGLNFIGFLLKIIGIGELVVGLASTLIFPLVFSDSNSLLQQFGLADIFPGAGLLFGIAVGLFIFLVGLVCGLLTYSAGEVFKVLIDIEENTRSLLAIQRDRN